ncbi:hypothetical protein GH714_023508 [Hevea brasiliensis]|uniref:Pyrrolidone-carboxylate peptidase n=1 Tax=Hevea brasiliensis TaxID=3981 RepID=A0A6A6KFJ3_HEVBR|nr:hypothetical protein GH714_023508 [Hevea brasiliensis]
MEKFPAQERLVAPLRKYWFLKKKGYEVTISDDAGRFVCNYVYYHSLRFAEQKGYKSLFVHVPSFLRIDEETQMHFVASLIEAIASTCQ